MVSELRRVSDRYLQELRQLTYALLREAQEQLQPSQEIVLYRSPGNPWVGIEQVMRILSKEGIWEVYDAHDLEKGETAHHVIQILNYLGSSRKTLGRHYYGPIPVETELSDRSILVNRGRNLKSVLDVMETIEKEEITLTGKYIQRSE